MSPRAAWRLEQLGFDQSFDYVGGKLDWLSFDLPWDGTARLVAGEMDRTVSTCYLGEKIADIRARFSTGPPGAVLSRDGVVAGTLEKDAFELDPDGVVDDVMSPGPTTVRPSEEVDELQERMQRSDMSEIIVTRPDGRLVGIYRTG